MKKTKNVPILGDILSEICPKIGAKLLIEPTWNTVGQITFKNKKKSYFRYNTLDINTMGASEIAKDKDYTNFFIKKMGYPIVPGSQTFFKKSWAQIVGTKNKDIEDACLYADKIGYPIIIKPNSGSQGSGVHLVHNKKELIYACKDIFENDKIALIQKKVSGKDYRIVVLGEEIISCYERIPLSITGDGVSNISLLLDKKQKQFKKEGRDTQIKKEDVRIKNKLKHQNLKLTSVPKKGEKIFLLDNANLSTGGESIDVTNKVHEEFKKIAINITKDMGLKLCGVDLMIDKDITEKPGKYWVLEINSSPGLDHYATTGEKQKKIVEDLYLKILKEIEKISFC